MIIPQEKIYQAKEKLGDKNAAIMAGLLGLDAYGYKDSHKGKLHCCFHQDDTASMVYNAKNYTFHCFGCQRTVDIIDCLVLSGKTFIKAVEYLLEEAGIQHSFGEVGLRTKHQYRYPKEVSCTSKQKAYDYLALRKISKETVDYADIREDEQGNIVFNYYDTNDVLTLVKYRPSHKIGKAESKSWCQKDADTTPLLFNMNRVNTINPLLITEGEIDCLSAIEAGYLNAVSVPLGAGNFGWIEECWDWLEQFSAIIICSDNDAAGLKMQKEVNYRLGSWRTKIVEVPQTITLPDGSVKAVKDLNQVLYYLGKDAVLELIMNAKESPVPSVKDLSDIVDVDLDSIDGIYTGIRDIDRELMKIFYGTLTIVSGTPGSGKTSLLYQIVCQALDQQKNCWLYSKELPDWMTKNWFNYIFAGRRHIIEYENNYGTKYYKVTNEAKAAINKHYKGRWFVYRDDYSCKISDIIQSMTDVVRKYGAKLLILDNMMTIDMDANENNELRKQTDVINLLIEFATRYNVAVILVAHPRKLQNAMEVGLYDISGTSNIINLAHRTLSIKRVTDKDRARKENPYSVMLTVLKDRIRGRANLNCGLYYDIPSRRFFSNEQEFAHNYKWDTHIHHEALPYPIADNSEEWCGRPCR